MNKGRERVFVCKPYYPDSTNIVWEDETWLRRALEDSESAFDIKKEKKQRRVWETEVNRDGRICGGGERKKCVKSRTALPFLSVSKQLIIEGQRGRGRGWRRRGEYAFIHLQRGGKEAGRQAGRPTGMHQTHTRSLCLHVMP